MRTTVFTSLLLFLTAVNAWLPHERNFFDQRRDTDDVTQQYARHKDKDITSRYLPQHNPIRGVNLGSLFVVEPWMANSEWTFMGCSGQSSESDCVQSLGQSAANSAFEKHWDTWISETDLDSVVSYGLNTIRVPVGYWIVESLVQYGEHFPQGGLQYLDRLVGWAADRGLYVILDLHGTPGAQVAKQAFTGQIVQNTGFYHPRNYARAYTFLQNMTERIHTNQAYRTTGTLEVLNEPESGHPNLVSTFYATAYAKIRDTERQLNIADGDKLTIMFMDAAWGSGDPSSLTNTSGVAYDDHRYLAYSDIPQTQSSYINASCSTKLTSNSNPNTSTSTPTIVGEWSLAVNSSIEKGSSWNPANGDNTAWYKKYWEAQTSTYESKGLGWVFWSWKSQLREDWRWSYQGAVGAGVITKTLGSASGGGYGSVCS